MTNVSETDSFIALRLDEVYHTTNPKHQSFLKALEYYQDENENVDSSYALRGIGLLYEHGDGVEQDYQKALIYYQDAAKERNRGAYYNIGLIYYYVYGVNKDYATSLEWFTKVIEEKIIDDARYVCVLNEKDDQAVDRSKIYSLESESFIYGEAHFYLGTMFKNGLGTIVDEEKAAEHSKDVISYGSTRAQDP